MLWHCWLGQLTRKNQGCAVLVFCGTATPTPAPGRTVWRTNCVLKDDLRQILNSSNERCMIVYKQSFSCKINCTTDKQTATKLHTSLDETQSLIWRRLRLLAKTWTPQGDSDSESTPLESVPNMTYNVFSGTLNPTQLQLQHRQRKEDLFCKTRFNNMHISLYTVHHELEESFSKSWIQRWHWYTMPDYRLHGNCSHRLSNAEILIFEICKIIIIIFIHQMIVNIK